MLLLLHSEPPLRPRLPVHADWSTLLLVEVNDAWSDPHLARDMQRVPSTILRQLQSLPQCWKMPVPPYT